MLTVTVTNTRKDMPGVLDLAIITERQDGRFHLHFQSTHKTSPLMQQEKRAHLSLMSAVDDGINTLYAQPYLEYARRG